jgi:hypothetical protein
VIFADSFLFFPPPPPAAATRSAFTAMVVGGDGDWCLLLEEICYCIACSIPARDTHTTACGHSLCRRCIREWKAADDDDDGGGAACRFCSEAHHRRTVPGDELCGACVRRVLQRWSVVGGEQWECAVLASSDRLCAQCRFYALFLEEARALSPRWRTLANATGVPGGVFREVLAAADVHPGTKWTRRSSECVCEALTKRGFADVAGRYRRASSRRVRQKR